MRAFLILYFLLFFFPMSAYPYCFGHNIKSNDMKAAKPIINKSNNTIIIYNYGKDGKKHYVHVRGNTYVEWQVDNLPFRIPIKIINNANSTAYTWPVKIECNFSDINIKPYNLSLLLKDVNNNTLTFQIDSYIVNSSGYLDYFELWFYASVDPLSESTYYLYFSDTPDNVSSEWIGNDVYTHTHNFTAIMQNSAPGTIDGLGLSHGGYYYNFSVGWDTFNPSNDPQGDNVTILWVEGFYNKYYMLLSILHQNASSHVNESWAVKTGIYAVYSGAINPGVQVLDSLLEVRINDTSRLTDIEDNLNGIYRLETHAMYIEINNTPISGIFAPLLESAKTIFVHIGPVFCEVEVINAPLLEYYKENSTPMNLSSYNIYENLSYMFFSECTWYYKDIEIHNGYVEAIYVDDNCSDQSLMRKIYEETYHKYNISPNDGGAMAQMFSWFDDESWPSPSDLNYTPKGNSIGLPYGFDILNIDDMECAYMYWASESLGRNLGPAIAYIVEFKENSTIGSVYGLQGSYFVSVNISGNLYYIYDGMFGAIGMNLSSITIDADNTITYSLVMGVENENSISSKQISNYREYMEEILDIFYNGLSIPTNTISLPRIQARDSSVHIYAQKISYTDSGAIKTNISSTIRLFLNGIELPIYNVLSITDTYGNEIYNVYVYKPLKQGSYRVICNASTIFGVVSKNTTVNVPNPQNTTITIDMPICDVEISMKYSPVVKEEAFNYPMEFNITLLNSSYLPSILWGQWTMPEQIFGVAKVNDIPFGNYSVSIKVLKKFYGVDISELWIKEFNNESLYLHAYADLGYVNVSVYRPCGEPIIGAGVVLNISNYYSSTIFTDCTGTVRIEDIPLSNRSNSLCGVNVSLNISDLDMIVYNTTQYNQSTLAKTINITLQIYKLFIIVTDAYNMPIDIECEMSYNTSGGWKTTTIYHGIYVFECYPSEDFLHRLNINISAYLAQWNITLKNSTFVLGINSDSELYISLNLASQVDIEICEYYFGERMIPNQIILCINLTETNCGTEWMLKSNGYITLSLVPLDKNYTIAVSYYYYLEAYNLKIYNTTTFLIDSNYIRVVIFYMSDIVIYAYPNYNNSIYLNDILFDISANGTIIVQNASSGSRGYYTLREFPSPVLYRISFDIYARGEVSGVYVDNNTHISHDYLVSVYGLEYCSSYTIGVALQVARVSIYICDMSGSPLDVILNLTYTNGNNKVLIISSRLRNGSATIELVPYGNYSIVVLHETIWGFDLYNSSFWVVDQATLSINLVLPLSIINVNTIDMDGYPVNATVNLSLVTDGVTINVSRPSINGVATFLEIPLVGASIIFDENLLHINSIMGLAEYNLLNIRIPSNYTEVAHDQTNTITLPLASVDITFRYRNQDNYVCIPVDGRLIMEYKGTTIYNIRLSKTSQLALKSIPLGYKFTLTCSYVTPYGITVETTANTTFTKDSRSYKFDLNIADLHVRVLDAEGMPLQGATVYILIRTSITVLVSNQTDVNGEVVFRYLPLGYQIETYASVPGAIEEISSNNEGVPLSLGGTSMVVNISVLDVEITVLDEDGNPVPYVTIFVERDEKQISATTNIDGRAHIGLLGLGEYKISLVMMRNNSRIPLNYSDTSLIISTIAGRMITLHASLAPMIADITISNYTIVKGEKIHVRMFLSDLNGDAVTGAQIYAALKMNARIVGYYGAIELNESPGVYVIDIDTQNLEHGSYRLEVYMSFLNKSIFIDSTSVYVHSKAPTVRLGIKGYVELGVGVIIFSIIITIIYSKLMRQLRFDPEEGIRKLSLIINTISMFLIVILLLTVGVPLFIGSPLMDPSISLIALVASLILAIVLCGILTYRDAIKSFTTGRFSFGKVFIWGWLFVMPIIILEGIMYLCSYIEWTQEYIVEQTSTWGPIEAPTLVLSFLSAYLTVFSAIIISSYRDIKDITRKIVGFREKGIPQDTINEEIRYHLRRISGGIRIRTLVFLGLLGLSAFSAVPVFRSIAFVIVAIPIALLIIGPYIGYTLIELVTKRRQ